MSPEEAETKLADFTIHSVGELARLDLGRRSRKGIPEIIFAENKTPSETFLIARAMVEKTSAAIVTRVNSAHIKKMRSLSRKYELRHYGKARIVVVKKRNRPNSLAQGHVGVLSAGTSDIPVAEEARIVAHELGCRVFTAYDVGIAGLHRLVEPLGQMSQNNVDVCVVVAGMEGALPSIVAGLVDFPIIGVPASTGYGFGGKGETALMSMLQSCSLGLAVVNIDNGVAAGALAALIAQRVASARKIH
ncbi:MAG: nickel pincer cofactor biosynthesis protein LarB [Candidatus Bathyarchaeia archaeon]